MTSRRWPRLAALACLGVFAGLGLIEFVLWLKPPRPAVQIVRNQNGAWNRVRLLNGTPVWGSLERENRACMERHPGTPSVIFLGDSILYGAGIGDEEVFSNLLDDALNKGLPETQVCVVNLAQAGFGFEQSYATAEEALAGKHPTLVFWELWGEHRDYSLLGEDAYNVDGMRLNADGFPTPSFARWLPAVANRWLFLHSRLYEYTALAFADRLPAKSLGEDLADYRDGKLARAARLVQGAGGHLVFVLGTPLDEPFSELRTDNRQESLAAAANEIARRTGAEVIRLQDLMQDQDYRQVRLDECCHFNPAGHKVLAKEFRRLLEPGALKMAPIPLRAATATP